MRTVYIPVLTCCVGVLFQSYMHASVSAFILDGSVAGWHDWQGAALLFQNKLRTTCFERQKSYDISVLTSTRL